MSQQRSMCATGEGRGVGEPYFFVVGENLVDLIVDEEGGVVAVPGGGPFNVARTAARLGQPTMFFSGISSDTFGRIVRNSLLDDQVRMVMDVPVQRPTSLAIVDLDQGSPEYLFHLENTAAFQLEASVALACMDQVGDDVAALYLGTLGLLIEPLASTGEAMCRAASPSTLVIVDPNCRPNAIRDEAVYRERLARLYRRADVVKVSTEDLNYLFPGVDHAIAAYRIIAQGPSCVIITDGASHVRVVVGDQILRIEVPVIDIVDTIGAGDALVGGFVAWWIGHGLGRFELQHVDQVAAAVSAAVAIAALTCRRHGAQAPHPKELGDYPCWDWLEHRAGEIRFAERVRAF